MMAGKFTVKIILRLRVKVIIFLLLIISPFIYGQNVHADIKMQPEALTNQEEISDLMLIEGIEGFKLKFRGIDLIDKHYLITMKEFWNGELTTLDTIMNSARYNDILKIRADSIQIKVMSKKLADKRLKVMFTFPKVRNTQYYPATNSDDYSLRILNQREDFAIKLDQPFYLLAYIMPYEKDGILHWCSVDQSGYEVEDWGKEFGLEHYLVYEMLFR